jgi:hypothetical protein
MGGTSSSTAGRRYRRVRRLRHSRRAVVAVIGTLLALLVFFALFGIFITQYVPLWMTDNESQFTAQAATAFAQFKSSVDAQYALGGPQSYGTSFPISSQGVPLVAQPTEGSLVFLPTTCPGGFFSKGSAPVGTAANYGQPLNPAYCVFANITESIGPGGAAPFSLAIPTGVLQLLLPDRYYSPGTFYYEDDGVIQSQSTGYQIMAFPPPLNISNVAGNITVHDSLLQLYGNSSTVLGQGSEEVYSHLRYSESVASIGGSSHTPFKFTFEIGTQNPCAWDPYLYNVLTAGLPAADYVLSNTFGTGSGGTITTTTLSNTFSGNCFSTTGATTILSFSILNVNFAVVNQAGIEVALGVGST